MTEESARAAQSLLNELHRRHEGDYTKMAEELAEALVSMEDLITGKLSERL